MKTSSQRMALFAEHFFAGLNARLAAAQARGQDAIRLDEGTPDMPPAAHIVETLQTAAARPDAHQYQPQRGLASLRQAWAGMYQRVHGVTLDPEREILPLIGSKEGVFHLPLAVIDPGDVVLIPDPGYITYTRGACLAGGEPYYLPLRAGRSYLPDLDAIPADVLRRARLLWLNYPNNPTAATAPREFLASAVDFCRKHNLLLCHDAAYAQVTFDGYRAPSLLEIPGAKEVAVEFNSLSKSHNMSGWRVGVLAGNPEVIRNFYTLKTNVDSGHFRPVQEAAVAALTGDQAWLAERNAVYQQRRDIVIQALGRMKLAAETPHASLYIWLRVPDGWSSADFTIHLFDRAGVSLTPGTVFGAGGEGYVRLALTAPADRLAEAMERVEAAISLPHPNPLPKREGTPFPLRGKGWG